jgi:dephospho-CoA kinase
MKIVALVGMAGSGKSIAAEVFKKHDYQYVRFGQAVLDEVMRRKLPINEANERLVREEMRADGGMGIMAERLIPTFDRLKKQNNVIADGLYSWEEYLLLKKRYRDDLIVVALYSDPKLRYKRLADRKLDPNDKKVINRPVALADCQSRDYSEIENLHKAGPIAMADVTIINDGSILSLKRQVESIIKGL